MAGRRRDGRPTGRRMVPPTPAEVVEAVRSAARYETDGWAHPTVIAMRLGVSRPTAVRYCKMLPNLLEEAQRYGWRYSKSVRSIRFRVLEPQDGIKEHR